MGSVGKQIRLGVYPTEEWNRTDVASWGVSPHMMAAERKEWISYRLTECVAKLTDDH